MGKKVDKGAAWIYCFKSGDKAVFLNRYDEVIKRFATYSDAEQYATKHIHLINKRIKSHENRTKDI